MTYTPTHTMKMIKTTHAVSFHGGFNGHGELAKSLKNALAKVPDWASIISVVERDDYWVITFEDVIEVKP